MPKTRVNEIDLLRFLAALAAVLFHYTFRGYAADGLSIMPNPPFSIITKYGYLGVDLFFMISGFVILMSASSGSLWNFVNSRIVRLYPAFWICCTITFLVTMWLGNGRYSVSLEQYLANLTMLSGFFGVPHVDGVYWTLVIELQFYFLVCLILAFKQMARIEPILAVWLGLSVLNAIHPLPKIGLFLIPDWSAYFIAGATYYGIWKNGISAQRILLVCGTLMLSGYLAVARLVWFESHYQTALSGTAVVLAIGVFHVVFMLIALRKTGIFVNAQWAVLGAITYPLYLLHQNIGCMIINVMYPAVDRYVLLSFVIGCMIGMAYLVHRFFERPLAQRMKSMLDRHQ